MTTATSFHRSNFGSFAGDLPADMDGYVHLTAEGWLSAPVDTGSEGPLTEEQAEDLAERAREATREAEAALAEWREENA